MKSSTARGWAIAILTTGIVLGYIVGAVGSWSGFLGLSYSFNTTGMITIWGIFGAGAFTLFLWAGLLKNQEIQIQIAKNEKRNQESNAYLQHYTNNKMTCYNCQTVMDSSLIQCPKCGVPITSQPVNQGFTSNQPYAQNQQPYVPVNRRAKSIFCIRCGNNLILGSRFCAWCGNAVSKDAKTS